MRGSAPPGPAPRSGRPGSPRGPSLRPGGRAPASSSRALGPGIPARPCGGQGAGFAGARRGARAGPGAGRCRPLGAPLPAPRPRRRPEDSLATERTKRRRQRSGGPRGPGEPEEVGSRPRPAPRESRAGPAPRGPARIPPVPRLRARARRPRGGAPRAARGGVAPVGLQRVDSGEGGVRGPEPSRPWLCALGPVSAWGAHSRGADPCICSHRRKT